MRPLRTLAPLLLIGWGRACAATLLALHNSHNKVETMAAVGVNGTRSIVESGNINSPALLATMETLHAANISITVSVRFRTVPLDDIERAAELSNFTSFAASIGPLCYSIGSRSRSRSRPPSVVHSSDSLSNSL